MVTYTRIASLVRSVAMLGGTALYGLYLVDWIGSLNYKTWSAGDQLWTSLGILSWFVALAFSVALPWEKFHEWDFPDIAALAAVCTLLPSAAMPFLMGNFIGVFQTGAPGGPQAAILTSGFVWTWFALGVTFWVLSEVMFP